MKIILCFIIIMLFMNPLSAVNIQDGDLDNDNYITVEDLRLLSKDIMTLAAPYRGDVDDNGYVTKEDLYFLIWTLLSTCETENTGITRENVNEFIQYILGAGGKNEKFRRTLELITENRKNAEVEKLQKKLDLLEKNINETKEIDLKKKTEENKLLK